MKNKFIGLILMYASALSFFIGCSDLILHYDPSFSNFFIFRIVLTLFNILNFILGFYIYKSLSFKNLITNKSNNFHLLVSVIIIEHFYTIYENGGINDALNYINYYLAPIFWYFSILLIRYDKMKYNKIIYSVLFMLMNYLNSLIWNFNYIKSNLDNIFDEKNIKIFDITNTANTFSYIILGLTFIILFAKIIKETIDETNINTNTLINSGFKIKNILNITIFFIILSLLKSLNYIDSFKRESNVSNIVDLNLKKYFSYPIALSISFLLAYLILIKYISKDFIEFKDNGNILVYKIKSVGIRFKNIIKYLFILIGINILLAFIVYLIAENGSMETLKLLQTLSLIPPLISLAYTIYYFIELNNISIDLINCEGSSNNNLINIIKINNVGNIFNSIYKLILKSFILIIIIYSFFALPILLNKYNSIFNIDTPILILESTILLIVTIIYLIKWNSIGNELINCDKD